MLSPDRVVRAYLQRQASKVGPYISFGKRIWYIGNHSKGQPGDTVTAVLVDSTGKWLKTEKHITFLGPGKVSVWENARRSLTVEYEDLGAWVPETTAKELMGSHPEVDQIKKSLPKGISPEEVFALLEAVAEDVNFHELAALFAPLTNRSMVPEGVRISDVSRRLDYTLSGAAALALSILKKSPEWVGKILKAYNAVIQKSRKTAAGPLKRVLYKGKPYDLLWSGKTKQGLNRAHLQFQELLGG